MKDPQQDPYWPSATRQDAGYPPGQPYDGFLRERRKRWKARDHARREAIRARNRILK